MPNFIKDIGQNRSSLDTAGQKFVQCPLCIWMQNFLYLITMLIWVKDAFSTQCCHNFSRTTIAYYHTISDFVSFCSNNWSANMTRIARLEWIGKDLKSLIKCLLDSTVKTRFNWLTLHSKLTSVSAKHENITKFVV